MNTPKGAPGQTPPILRGKRVESPSVFEPEALLREARRQKGLCTEPVPPICILDPDGDMARHLQAAGRARRFAAWPCYHTELLAFELDDMNFGIVACAVGAPFAVLVAEELFACGCELLISVTSAGRITAVREPPYFVVLDRALRDEGTSYHYQTAGDYSAADPRLVKLAARALRDAGLSVEVGASWTTDAPFRETEEAITAARQAGILAVEMEAAALYAFAAARGRPVLCLAHVTNQMGQVEGDFEKGAADGAEEALQVISLVARPWQTSIGH